MTRRNLVAAAGLLAMPRPALTAPAGEEYTEFIRRVNAFTVLWNQVMNNVLEGKWDIKVAEKTVEAFQQVVEDPVWLRKRK